MSEGMILLRRELAKLAGDAAEYTMADADLVLPPLRSLLTDLYTGLHLETPLDLSGLRGAGISDDQIVRLLRAAEALSMDVLWGNGQQTPHRECIAALRQRIRLTLGAPRPNPKTLENFRILLDEGGRHAAERDPYHALFEGVMETLRDMVYIHDPRGSMLYLNRRALAVTRYAPEDLAEGLNIYDFVPPQYWDVIEDRLEATGQVPRAPFTIEVFARDGERIPVEILTRAISVAGQPAAVVGIARDLRLERRLQDQIEQSNTSLQDIVANAPLGILVVDEKGVIQEANPAAVSLSAAPSAHALFGTPLHDLADATPSVLQALLRLVARRGKTIHTRRAIRTRYGADVHCELSFAPLRSGARKVRGVLVLCQDVTEQVMLQQTLVQSEKLSAIGELVEGVAHELNNPLTGILGFTQLLLSAATDPSLRARLDAIEQEAQRCRRIVQNLLTFAQRQEGIKTSNDINQIVQSACDFIEYQMRVDGIALNVDLAPNLPPLTIEPYALQRAFLNILSNAHTALLSVQDRTRRIRVQTSATPTAIQIVFHDNGPGIPEAVRSRVFDPFFTTKPRNERLGLGLSVCFGIVKDHGGDILVDSVEGEGATFTVLLPLHPVRPRRR